MRYILFIFSCLTLFFGIISTTEAKPESGELDSLKQLIARQDDNTAKVDNILVLAREYTYIDKDSAMVFSDQALALSIQLKYQKGQLDALYRKGLLQKQMGNIQRSFQHYTEFLDLSEKLQDSINMADGYFQYGILYRLQGKERQAIYFHKKSLDLYVQLRNPVGLISNFNSIGNIFQNISAYDSAAYYYMKTIKLCQETEGKEQYLATVYLNLGEVFLNLGDFDNAREYLGKALEYAGRFENNKAQALAYTKLGNLASEMTDLDSALFYYQKAEPLYAKIKDELGINDLFINNGMVYEKKGLYNQAFSNFNRALFYYKSQDYPEGIITAWQNIATVMSKQKKYTDALITLDSCIKLTLATGLNNERLGVLKQISDISYESGDFKRSFDYLSRHNILKDSIYKLEKEEMVADLRIQYERELDQAKILVLENENLRKTKQRDLYLFSGLGIIALILFLLSFFWYKSRKDKIIAAQKIRQLEEEKKLLAARFLVEGQEEERKRIAKELHDGLGVLLSVTKMQFSAIKDASPENRPLIEKATKFLEQASGDVRKISHNMMPGLLAKLGLYEALEDLFERINDTEGIHATCDIRGAKERLAENKEIMLYRIIQEMVNNTIKHARAKNIELNFIILSNRLDIRFSDDGTGFKLGESGEPESIGLQSIWSRVKFLDGTISIESSAGKGTVYTIQIPV